MCDARMDARQCVSRRVTLWALVCFYYQWQILTLFKFELRLLIRHRQATFIHWPFLDKTLISRSGTCLEKVRTPAPACNFHEDFMCFGCLLRRGFACSKIVTKCYYFWHKSRGSRAFNCRSQEKEDKHGAPYKPGTWIGRRVQVGKCAVLYLESS